jgi:putative transposase
LDEVVRDSKARRERAQTVALWRYALVAPAMDEQLTARERGLLVRELASREHPGPFGGRVRPSRKTLDRWIRTRRRGGFDALVPAARRVEPRTDAAVLALAVALKTENPRRTAAQVRRILVEMSPQAVVPAERTLQRHFAARGLTIRPDGRTPKVRGRFEAERINEIWTADTLHGPKVAGRKAYIHGIIDDHSRLLVDYQCTYRDDSARFMTVLRHAIATRGVPSTLYVDNGAPFVDEALLRTCARLGIRVTHSAPGEPEGRGKVERAFRTVREQFLVEVHGDRDNPVGHYVADLAAMSEALRLWVTRVYHRQVHSETKQTPLQRWADGDPPQLPGPELLRRAFAWTVARRVRKNARVELEGNRYKVDDRLARKDIELHYDPFDLTDIEVYWLGNLIGKAVPEHIGRHSHPKAPPEVEPDPVALTGVDFIELLDRADRAETAHRLHLSHLAEPDQPGTNHDDECDGDSLGEQSR